MFDPFSVKKPFHERLEVDASLSNGQEEVGGLHLVISYPLISPGQIIGHIVSGPEKYEDLTRINDRSGGHLRLRTESLAGPLPRSKIVRSDRVSILSIGEVVVSHQLHYVYVELSFSELSINAVFEEGLYKGNRILWFALQGPKDPWHCKLHREWHYDGNEKVSVNEPVLDLGQNMPFTVKILPRFFKAESENNENIELKTYILTLQFETDLSSAQLSNDDFLKQAKSVVKDLISVASFLSQRRIVWYRYEYFGPDAHISHIRKTSKAGDNDLSNSDYAIQGDFREYIKTAYTHLNSLREKGIDLFLPIIEYVSASEAEYLEDKFISYFIVLEKLKDMHACQRNQQYNLPEKKFRKIIRRSLRSSLEKVALENQVSPEAISKMIEKLPDLNRPPFRAVLDDLMAAYFVEWKDLYPEGEKLSFINTRDKLFHSSKEVDIETLSKEMVRLKSLVERLIFRMLGWRHDINAPLYQEKKWLTSK